MIVSSSSLVLLMANYVLCHCLIQMLMEGVLQRLAEAKGAMRRNVIADKGKAIGKEITILSGLDDCLNRDIGRAMAPILMTRIVICNVVCWKRIFTMMKALSMRLWD